MADPFSVESPRWLQQSTQPSPGTGKAGIGLAGLFNAISGKTSLNEGVATARMNEADPMWKLKAEGVKANLLGQITQNELQLAKLKDQNQELVAWQQDISTMAPWLAATPEQRKTLPRPAPHSRMGINYMEKTEQSDIMYGYRKAMGEAAMRKAEAGTTAAKMATKDAADFAKALEGISPEGRANVKKIQPNPDGTPSAAQWQSLRLEQETLQTEKENKARMAEAEAMSRGDEVTTTITGDKVTKSFKSPTPQKGTREAPPAINLGGGRTGYWTGTTMHVLKDPKAEALGKAAYEKWHQALLTYNSVLKTTPKSDRLPALKQEVEELERALSKYYEPVKMPASAPGSETDGGGAAAPTRSAPPSGGMGASLYERFKQKYPDRQ